MSRDFFKKLRRFNRAMGIVSEGPLGAREKVELRAAIMGGERSVPAIAADLGISERTVDRERAAMRIRGMRVPDVVQDWSQPERHFGRSA